VICFLKKFDAWLADLRAVFALMPSPVTQEGHQVMEMRRKAYIRFKLSPSLRRHLEQLQKDVTAAQMLQRIESRVRPNLRKETFELFEKLFTFKARNEEKPVSVISRLEDLRSQAGAKGIKLSDVLCQ